MAIIDETVKEEVVDSIDEYERDVESERLDEGRAVASGDDSDEYGGASADDADAPDTIPSDLRGEFGYDESDDDVDVNDADDDADDIDGDGYVDGDGVEDRYGDDGAEADYDDDDADYDDADDDEDYSRYDGMSYIDILIDKQGLDTEDKERAWFERAADEKTYSDWYAEREYPRYRHPDVTVDCVILAYDRSCEKWSEAVKSIVVQRFTNPFKGQWCLPGTFLRSDDDDATETIKRLLSTRLGVKDVDNGIAIKPLSAFTGLRRDPRGQVVSLAYVVYLKDGMSRVVRQQGVDWVSVAELEDLYLAFDHNDIVDAAMKRIRDTFAYEPDVFMTLPDSFLMSDAFRIRESLFYDKKFDANTRKNFRKHYAELWTKIGNVNPNDPHSPTILKMRYSDMLIRNRY